jgi:hypothetical protein
MQPAVHRTISHAPFSIIMVLVKQQSAFAAAAAADVLPELLLPVDPQLLLPLLPPAPP